MAPSLPQPSRSHVERGLARHILAQRSSITPRNSSLPSPATPSPSKTAPAGVTLPPHGSTALIGIVVTLSVFILAFSTWRLLVWRRRKSAAASSEFLEKKPGLYSPVDTIYSLTRSPSKPSAVLNIVLPSEVKAALTHDRRPQDFKSNLNYQPKVIYLEPNEKSQDLPTITVTPAAVIPNAPALQITPPPHYVETPAPALSPRTASKKQSMLPIPKSAKLPRLVTVESTFTANLHDELEIRVGETLRLLEEYEDEWCLVQRVGRADAEKGVVPRFCIVDKPDPPPAKKSKHIPRISEPGSKI